ncbi:MAG: ATP12 family protein [Hyphomonadaceae bacterium]|nr:ATP12 family protein [Hyphomonadaceae bacterium]
MSGLRRFYESASVQPQDGGFAVYLDARRLKTPAQSPALAPTRALADACAAEWAAQGAAIDTQTMPLTRLWFTALDRTDGRTADIVAEICKYGETDLLCHRAERPEILAARQDALWSPWISWSRAALGFAPTVTTVLTPAPLHREGIAALAARANTLDAFRLTALAHGVAVTGSAILGFALLDAAIDPQTAFEAAALDNLFSIETWGEDGEARARLDRQAKDIADLARFVSALA